MILIHNVPLGVDVCVGVEQGRARGIRGRLYPFVSCDSEGDQITLLGSYSLLLDRIPRQLADMEWDTLNHADDIELSSNCLTATKTAFNAPSTVRGTILYTGVYMMQQALHCMQACSCTSILLCSLSCICHK